MRTIATTLCVLMMTCLTMGANGPLFAASPDDVWVTMGEDAFERFGRSPGILSDLLPPVALETRAGVVLTRLSVRDLPRVSSWMHDEFNRCSGFIVHSTEDEALEVLAKLDQGNVAPLMSQFQIGQQALVGQLLPDLQASQILGTISHLSTAYNNRYYLNISGQQAALWIRDTWQGYAGSRTDVTVETYTHNFVQPSVILTIQGTTLPDEVVVLGAHLDSIHKSATNTDSATLAPGADDDASGIAALTDVIRVLMEQGVTTDRTVKFMGYAAEEVGLVGSGEIAQDFLSAGTNVVAVMQLDMTNYNGSVEDIALISDYTNADLTAFVGTLIDTYLPELQWTSTACGYGCSDHASWHNRGFPAVFPFEARFGDHNAAAIHTENDTLANLGNSAAHALKFAKLATAFAVETSTSPCGVDADCDDGQYCNGQETCSAGVCIAPQDPCSGGACDEAADQCTSVCGDGQCDAGETCSGCPADCPSFALPSASPGNGLCEVGDGEDCVNTPQDCNGVQGGKPASRFCCGNGGTNPVGCGDPACTTGGFSCTETPQGPGGSTCCGDLICQSPEDSLNCPLDCGAAGFCGDGTCDLGETSCSCATDCGAAPGSEGGSCADGVDNDCDLAVDCSDSDCAADAACQAVDCSTIGDKNTCNAEATCRWDNRSKTCVPN